MRFFSILTIGFLIIGGNSQTGVAGLVCERTGMAGVTFGSGIEQHAASVIEVTGSGVTYFRLEPSIDIQPFERLIAGVSPKSKQVFSIRLEKHGNAEELDQIIQAFKDAISQSHVSLSWRVIGNHHYGDGLDGLDVALYRIGDIVDSEQTYFMSYDCDSKTYRKNVIDEVRGAISGN